jgi:hypothetical protein
LLKVHLTNTTPFSAVYAPHIEDCLMRLHTKANKASRRLCGVEQRLEGIQGLLLSSDMSPLSSSSGEPIKDPLPATAEIGAIYAAVANLVSALKDD